MVEVVLFEVLFDGLDFMEVGVVGLCNFFSELEVFLEVWKSWVLGGGGFPAFGMEEERDLADDFIV